MCLRVHRTFLVPLDLLIPAMYRDCIVPNEMVSASVRNKRVAILFCSFLLRLFHSNGFEARMVNPLQFVSDLPFLAPQTNHSKHESQCKRN